MRIAKCLVFLGCASLFASASASFDLSLVTDSGTNSVHRIDPISNVYLGSFGGGILSNPRGVVVNQTTQRAYVLDGGSRISTWNYNTGAFISSFSSGVMGASFLSMNSDGTMNIAGAGTVRRVSQAGVTLANYVRNGTLDVQSGILLRDGFFYMSTRMGSTPVLERFNYASGAYLGASNWLADRMTPIADIPGSIANTFNAYVVTTTVFAELDLFNAGPNLIGGVTTTLIDTSAGVAAGHGNMMFVLGRDKAVPTRGGIGRFDMNTFTWGSTLAGTGQIVTPTGLANIVAPEPSSLLALAAGAWLLRRSRKARS